MTYNVLYQLVQSVSVSPEISPDSRMFSKESEQAMEQWLAAESLPDWTPTGLNPYRTESLPITVGIRSAFRNESLTDF